jgi:hypothetical protein
MSTAQRSGEPGPRQKKEKKEESVMSMKKFVIEREIEGVGQLDSCGLSDAARQSNKALAELSPRVQWQQSYVTADRTFCIYLAEDEQAIRDHAKLSGFPANRIIEVTSVIDPSTAVG